MNEVRQVLTAHAAQSLMDERNVLHITLGNVLDSSLDAPRRFNELSAAERIRVARSALAQAGAINVVEAPVGLLNLVEGPPARAMDSKPRCSHDGLFGHVCGPSGITEGPDKISAEDVAAFRRVLARLKGRRRRGADRHDENRVASDSGVAQQERQVRASRDYGYREIDRGSKLPRSPRAMDADRPLGFDGKPMSDLQYFQRRALECSGGRA
jgi:hypothetical protein